ncbi:MAG: hypothetical protein HKN26_14390 [Acidimicrobiales bacterium]|nr:hypothetical protein [Acidimicrobiales bacterium]
MSGIARARDWLATRVTATGFAVVAITLIPIVRMVRHVVGGTHLQYSDYWFMIDELLARGGGIEFEQLFTFRNEHPVFFAKALYLINIGLSNGSNIVQGLIVVVVVIAITYLLIHLSRATGSTDTLTTLVMAGAAASFLFAPQSVWTFYKGMSGSAWWTANLFAVIALVFVHRDRRWAAAGAAVLASISYGTGIVIWPAIAVATMIRSRRWYPPPEALVGFAATAVWYQVAGEGNSDFSFDELWLQMRVLATLIGALLPGPDRLMEYSGFAVFGTGLALAAYLAWRDKAAAVWVALFLFAVGNLALITNGRWVFLAYIIGVQGRYGTLAALVWFGWAMMLIHAARDLMARTDPGDPLVRLAPLHLLPIVAIAIAVGFGGGEELDEMREAEAAQSRLEIALRFGFSEGRQSAFGETFPDLGPRLDSIGHYPFTDTRSFDCGLAGSTLVPDSDMESIGVAVGPVPSTRAPNQIDFDVTVEQDVELDCVVVVDAALEVVGAGVQDLIGDADDPETSYEVLARDTAGPYRIIGIDQSGAQYEFVVTATGN